jgi:hypothetical protein
MTSVIFPIRVGPLLEFTVICLLELLCVLNNLLDNVTIARVLARNHSLLCSSPILRNLRVNLRLDLTDGLLSELLEVLQQSAKCLRLAPFN